MSGTPAARCFDSAKKMISTIITHAEVPPGWLIDILSIHFSTTDTIARLFLCMDAVIPPANLFLKGDVKNRLAELEAIYSTIPIGLCVLNRELRYVYVNERLAEFNGLPVRLHTGKTFREVTPYLADHLEARLQLVLKTGKPIWNLDLTVDEAASPVYTHTWSVSCYPLRRSDNRIVGLNMVMHKLADQKRTNKRDRTIFENTAAGILIVNSEAVVLDANPAMSDLLGYSWHEIVGQPVRQFFPPATNHDQSGFPLDFSTPGTYQGEFSLIRKSGEPVYLDWRITDFDESGAKLCFVLDVTEREQAEERLRKAHEALHQSEDRYRALFDLSAVGQEELDPATGRFLAVNRKMCEITGYTREELLVKTYLDITHPEDQQSEADRIRSYLTHGTKDHYSEKRIVRKDGAIRIVEVRTGIVRDSDNLMRSIGTVIDVTDRIEAEAANRSSQELLRLVTDSVPVLISYVDNQQRYRFNNAGYERWFDISREDLIGKHIHEVVGHRAYKVIRPQLEAALSGKRVTYEAEVVYSNGVLRLIHADYVPHFVDNRVVGCCAVISDVSERRRTEKALHETEARMAAVLRSLPVGVGVTNMQGKMISMNPAGLSLHGFSSADELFKGLEEYQKAFELCYPDGSLMPVEEWPLSKALRGEQINDYEVYLHRLSDQSKKVVSYTVAPVQEGDTLRYIFVIQDVTERRRAEQSLIEREREFRTLANSIPQLAWMTDEKGWIIWYNDRWYDYTGSTHEEMQGMGWTKVHHPNHINRVVDRYTKAMNEQQSWEDTFPLRSKNGDYRWFLSRALPIRDEKGRVLRWFGTNTDITEKLELERELRELNDTLERRVAIRTTELEARNRELQQFAYVASHDMQEPLRKIQTFADLTNTDFGDQLGEEGRFYLERIGRAAERMSQLLSDMLTFSHVATRHQPFTWTSIETVMTEVLTDLDLAIAQAGATVEVRADTSIQADVNQIRQLLNHLVLNAIKFRREGVSPHVRISATIAGGICHLEVSDNGIGFEKKYAERIFEPFERLHGRTAFPGTGMGLAIVKRIVERHRGKISVESKPGQGTRFIIDLPVRQKEVA